MIHSRLLSALLALCLASRAFGQASPRISASALIGPQTTTGGDFQLTSGIAREIAVTVRVAVVHGVAVTSTGALGGLFSTGYILLISCPPHSPVGGCGPVRANVSGPSLRVGVERFLNAHFGLSASAGTGWYHNEDPGSPGGAHAFPLNVAVIVPVAAHFAILAHGSRVVFRDYGGVNFRSDALLLGLRVQ